MKFTLSATVALTCCAQLALSMSRQKINFRLPPAGKQPISSTTARNHTFEQLIDHTNPALGTFSQFYYWDDKYYKGPGSPVVFFTPGEIDVTAYFTYLTTERTTGVIAKELGAAVVVIEHRYWGNSSPFKVLSTENMQHLTLANAIADLNNFALTAKLPFDTTGASNADKAPWILVGGSYSGALTAWTQATTSPSVMWAYYASSAVVEAVGNFWEYFSPETQFMPQNCSTDISVVVEHLDNVFATGTLKKQAEMKTMFGLGDLTNYNDFMETLVNGPYLWQGNQFFENAGFFEFCDAVEGVTSKSVSLPGASGVGLDKALVNYAAWVKDVLIPGFCASFGYFKGENNIECFDTYNKNSPMYTDLTLTNTYDRQWDWMLCNEPFGYWQNGAPAKEKTIVSRLINNEYWTRQCKQWFPEENGVGPGVVNGKKYGDVNLFTGGWTKANTTRLIFVNGEFDPWRQSTVSSSTRPGGPLLWTPEEPVFVVPGGFHTSDLVTANGEVNPDCAEVQSKVVKQIKAWVMDFPSQ